MTRFCAKCGKPSDRGAIYLCRACSGIETESLGRWMEEYGCGCSNVARRKRELSGYCPKHGNTRKNVYKLPESVKCGLSS